MLGQGTVADQILSVVKTHADCTLDELMEHMQECNWSEVFIEVDRLSRMGLLRLTQSCAGFVTTLRTP